MTPVLTANYHTHTARCGHAVGGDRDYVEAAAAAGITTLGFSDHAPIPFPDGYVSPIRMHLTGLPGYIASLCLLREEYADRMKIEIGFESEYLPDLFQDQLSVYADYPVDYLILGQHFLDREDGGPYMGRPFDDRGMLTHYVDQVVEGLGTGRFRCLAHPDLVNFIGDEAFYLSEMKRLCREVHAMNIPLECNILGFRTGRNYPCRRFWELAAEEGGSVILGVDAHDPAHFSDPQVFTDVRAFLDSLGITPLEKLD